MKIRIEVDLTPSELRALIGLPDVAGLQEDMIEYLRDRVSNGVEGIDPAGFVKESLLQSNKAFKRLLSVARLDEALAEDEEEPAPKRKRAARGKASSTRASSTKKPPARRRTAKKP